MAKTPRITKAWCKRTRGKTQAQRKKCHKLIYGTKLPKRKYKRRK